MKSSVVLEVTDGSLVGKKFRFDERDTALVGRGLDCNIRLPDDKDHATISRNHCIIDINPPSILIHDFASLNGTFVNDELIGRRKEENTTDETEPFSERPLYDGDTVRIGGTTFKISVSESAPKNEEQPAPSSPTLCTQCGKRIGEKQSGNENPVCPDCRQEVRNLIANLLKDADKGDEELVSIKGFSIKKELGRGGMGAVYLARAENEDRDIAIKVMLPETFADLESRKTFLREAEVTQALKHPNIVTLYDTGFHNGIFYFTMEYCDGGSMDQHVKAQGGKLGWSEALGLIGPCLDGLEYLHNAGIRTKLADGTIAKNRGLVHRDIKPSNIFLVKDGERFIPKIADIGLGKAFDSAGLSGHTRSGATIGTPFFMARQQVTNFKYSKPDVDIFSIAATLYFMLTGKFARKFMRGKDQWHTVLSTSCVPIKEREPDIPESLATVIDMALIDQPAIHFKSALEFKTALFKAV